MRLYYRTRTTGFVEQKDKMRNFNNSKSSWFTYWQLLADTLIRKAWAIKGIHTLANIFVKNEMEKKSLQFSDHGRAYEPSPQYDTPRANLLILIISKRCLRAKLFLISLMNCDNCGNFLWFYNYIHVCERMWNTDSGMFVNILHTYTYK